MTSYTLDGRGFTQKICGSCGIEFYVPSEFEEECLDRGPEMSWTCPNGHTRHYLKGRAKKDNERREIERLRQRLAQKDDEIAHQKDLKDKANRRAAAAKGQVTRLKNRAANGVCPCCKRHFTDLERHMASKHPDFEKEHAA